MEKQFTTDQVRRIAEESGFRIVTEEITPGNNARFAPPPSHLNKNLLKVLGELYGNGLYRHQEEAISTGLEGHDICISTSTASGKSLVFMSLAINAILTDGTARVLVFYPVRALIQDQMDKWASLLQPLNISLGYIDGGVPMDKRLQILSESSVLLMTPDVAHAWLLSSLGKQEIKAFLQKLQMMVLDEAHIYDGVFGTNMAYFLRRIQAVAKIRQIVTSTATLDDPEGFVYQLTGRHPKSFGPDSDNSSIPPKTILLAEEVNEKGFESTVALLKRLARADTGRYIAFGDTRKMVELLVMALKRPEGQDDKDDDQSSSIITEEVASEGSGRSRTDNLKVLPYRAGYETVDRNEIQKALAQGELRGVVSTSALELGIDIGEIDLIVLLNQPPTLKAFWQRVGRGGRKREGICLFIDNRGAIADRSAGLQNYILSPVEPNWLYLENRYIQYANALCAAVEFSETDANQYHRGPFDSVPPLFKKLFENEINPSEIIPNDLYPLKQRAQAGPHREFPIRTNIEKSFQVRDQYNSPLGSLTFSQVLREAYPGAIYYYMGRPYRVNRFKYRQGEIYVHREKRWTTKPKSMTTVFPSFGGGILQLFSSDAGFIAESEMQVSERVTGFTEQRGSAREDHEYSPSSSFWQKPLNRFFATTGVCWWFSVGHVLSDITAKRLIEAFSYKFGVQTRDLGVGIFHSNFSPITTEKCKGICIYDSTNGSLRLTEKLASHFKEILEEAIHFAYVQKDSLAVHELEEFASLVRRVKPRGMELGEDTGKDSDENWVTVLASGEKGIYNSGTGPTEVVVLDYRYTPQGLMYELQTSGERKKFDINTSLSKNAQLSKEIVPVGGVKWLVAANTVQPIPGQTKLLRVNLLTGETEPS